MPKPSAIPTSPPYIDWPLDRWKLLLMLVLTLLLLWGALYLRANRQPGASPSLPPSTMATIPHINAIH